MTGESDTTPVALLAKIKAQLPPGYAVVKANLSDAFYDDASRFWLNGNVGPGRAKGDRYAKAFRRMWAYMIERAAA